MAKFSGSPEEFKRYFGPHLRNLVQQITKSHKKNIGACEHCGSNRDLQSAHVRGRDRSQIIDYLLPFFLQESKLSVDLQRFEAMFLAEHIPIEKAILVLCKICHTKYDSAPETASTINSTDGKRTHTAPHSGLAKPDILPISFDPPNIEEFKKCLLIRKGARMLIKYTDGREEIKVWDASGFKKTSNAMRNLRSRKEFRQGKWQDLGIAAVHVTVTAGT